MPKRDMNEFVRQLLPTPILYRVVWLLLGVLLMWVLVATFVFLMFLLIGLPLTFPAAVGWTGLGLLLVGVIALLRE